MNYTLRCLDSMELLDGSGPASKCIWTVSIFFEIPDGGGGNMVSEHFVLPPLKSLSITHYDSTPQ